jgi:uncharacterized protein YbaR (Trm112 family)
MTEIDPEFLRLLRCPETHQCLQQAGAVLIEKLNERIAAGQVRDQSGKAVGEKLDGGLVRDDGRRLYPIRREIPVLLIEESIPLD